jgi:hypothetical protein
MTSLVRFRFSENIDIGTKMMSQNPGKSRNVRVRNLDVGFQPPGSPDGPIDLLWPVGGPDDDNTFALHRAVQEFEKFVDAGVPLIRVLPQSANTHSDAVYFVDEQDARRKRPRFRKCPCHPIKHRVKVFALQPCRD